jgi:predicted nucleic acid-binding protein
MLVVDSTVWVDLFRGYATRHVSILRVELTRQRVLVGDLVMHEVLRGFRTDAVARLVAHQLDHFAFATMGGREIAARAADHYRRLRSMGITVRKTVDLLIGTFCIERGLPLLHADRDYEPMAAHLGLVTI